MYRTFVIRDRFKGLREEISWLIGLFLLINVFGGLYYVKKDLFGGLGFILGVALGFVTHEMGHRSVAQRLMCRARFTIDLYSVLFTSSIALIQNILLLLTGRGLPFIVALPGYVLSLCGFITRSSEGIIALAGPLTNITLAIIALILGYILQPIYSLKDLISAIAYVNIMLALFNLIPIPPLDGYKIVRWNIFVWLLLVLIALMLITL
ncbi:MAG: site-2 protease family protein [Sulfolobales archaeon]